MAKKKTGISEELREAINEAARAGAYEAYKDTAGAYVNYFKAMETLLYNYKKLAALVADEEAYCEVEYHAGRKTFAAGSKSTGFYEQRTEADNVEEMREEKRRQYRETKYGFERLERAINLYRDRKEFTVVRMYYFGEDYEGKPRESGKPYTWEELAFDLEEAGVLKGRKDCVQMAEQDRKRYGGMRIRDRGGGECGNVQAQGGRINDNIATISRGGKGNISMLYCLR